jgi:hypothetical protein
LKPKKKERKNRYSVDDLKCKAIIIITGFSLLRVIRSYDPSCSVSITSYFNIWKNHIIALSLIWRLLTVAKIGSLHVTLISPREEFWFHNTHFTTRRVLSP